MEDPKRLEEGLAHTKPENKEKYEDVSEKIEKSEGSGEGNHGVKNGKEERNIIAESQKGEQQPPLKQKTKRVATLDAFRGLTVVIMLGGSYPRIDPSPWNGCTLADFVMPLFLLALLSSPASGPLREDAPSWCLAPFELEDFTISAILSGTIGIHYGHVLIHFKTHTERHKQWVSMGLGLLIIAIILHFTDAIPINKQLYSFSYVCFTAGAAGIVFSGFYILIDVWGLRPPFLFLEWIGMNAMLVYVMDAQGIFEGFINGWFIAFKNMYSSKFGTQRG